MEECQVEVAIKKFAENIPQKSLLITFNGDVRHRIGTLKARKITGNKWETIAKQFQQNISLEAADVYRKKVNALSPEAFVAGNRSDMGVTKSVLQNISCEMFIENIIPQLILLQTFLNYKKNL